MLKVVGMRPDIERYSGKLLCNTVLKTLYILDSV